MEKYINLLYDCTTIGTATLEERLKTTKDINSFFEENAFYITDPTLSQHLNKLLSQKGLKRQDVIEAGNLDDGYVNQLFNGNKKKPGRDIILSLAFGLGLNNEETDRLIKIAGVGALYSKSKRDAVIIYALKKGKSINETDIILKSYNLEPLYKENKSRNKL